MVAAKKFLDCPVLRIPPAASGDEQPAYATRALAGRIWGGGIALQAVVVEGSLVVTRRHMAPHGFP